MRLIFAGTPDTALPSLQALLDSEHDVIAVLTRPDAPAGRGRTVTASPVKELARSAGIEVLTPPTPRDAAFQDRLRELAPDACPVVAYGALLPADVLDVPTHGWVNLHFSLLPAWRGAAPVQRALMSGDVVTGASTFIIEEGLDTGPILGMMTEQIRPSDTAGELLDRLARAGAGLLVATMDGLAAGDLTAAPQALEGVSHAAKLTSADARVDFGKPAFAIERLIRGCTPEPGAWTTFRGQRLGLGPLAPSSEDGPSLPPGVLAPEKRCVRVGTATGSIVLGEVQPQGKRAMAAADWARGVRIESGEVLGA